MCSVFLLLMFLDVIIAKVKLNKKIESYLMVLATQKYIIRIVGHFRLNTPISFDSRECGLDWCVHGSLLEMSWRHLSSDLVMICPWN